MPEPKDQPIRLYLAVSDNDVRARVRRIAHMRATCEVVGEATDGRTALRQIRRLDPDVLIMALDDPATDKLGFIRGLADEHPGLRQIVMAKRCGTRFVVRAIAVGADGCLSPTADHDAVLAAIDAAHAGRPLVSPELMNLVLEDMRRLNETDGGDSNNDQIPGAGNSYQATR